MAKAHGNGVGRRQQPGWGALCVWGLGLCRSQQPSALPGACLVLQCLVQVKALTAPKCHRPACFLVLSLCVWPSRSSCLALWYLSRLDTLHPCPQPTTAGPVPWKALSDGVRSAHELLLAVVATTDF